MRKAEGVVVERGVAPDAIASGGGRVGHGRAGGGVAVGCGVTVAGAWDTGQVEHGPTESELLWSTILVRAFSKTSSTTSPCPVIPARGHSSHNPPGRFLLELVVLLAPAVRATPFRPGPSQSAKYKYSIAIRHVLPSTIVLAMQISNALWPWQP